MAKFGEGDARYLVQDRADGTNVNAWHWVERDAMDWSRQRLGSLFKGMQPLGDSAFPDHTLTITGLAKLEGEAIVNNRKQKIIPAYELDISLSWEGSVQGEKLEGKIHLPYVADENHDETPELRFAPTTDGAAAERLKQAFLQGPGRQAVIAAIEQFVKELRAGGPMAPAEPGGPGSAPTPAAAQAGQQQRLKFTSADPAQVAVKTSAAAAKQASSASSFKSSLHIKEQFYCRAADLYECFTHPGRLQAFTQSPATVELRVGGAFSWFGGSVKGTFTGLETNKRIAMDWGFSSWADGCLSKVVISLEEPEPGTTFLTLEQTDIPKADRFGSEDVYDVTMKGWKVQVLLRIRQVFGYGLGL